MTPPDATRVVLLTGTGRAAVATLRVEGPEAIASVGALFHPASGQPLEAQPVGRVLFGRWRDPVAGEEVVVCRREAEAIEIHCHGGAAASAAIRAALVEHGCVDVDWRDWVRRTEPDPVRAEARIALAGATTQRTALILWDQYEGALGREVDAIIAAASVGDATAALAGLDRVLAWQALGRHLTEPWKVVLAGPPNVGKSSLINALLGYERAIVHDQPGTTRDVVSASTAVEGWPIELADTAGLRASDAPLEAAGMERARSEASAADLVLLVADRSRALSPEEEALARAWPGALRVWNKCDLPPGTQGPHEGLAVSALRGDGIAELVAAIAARLVPQVPSVGEAVPFAARQVEVLAAARDAIAREKLTEGVALLAPLGSASS